MELVLLSRLREETIRKYWVFGYFTANDTQRVVGVNVGVNAFKNDMVEAGYHVSFNAGCADLIWG